VWDRNSGQAAAPRGLSGRTAAPRRAARPLKKEGFAPTIAAENGPRHRSVFLGDQALLVPRRPSRACARAAERGRARLRHDRTSWLAWKLSDGKLHITDPSNASRTMLYDIHRASGTTSCCGSFAVPAGELPECCLVARLRRHRQRRARRGSRDRGIAGDQQARLRPGCHEAGSEEHLRHGLFPGCSTPAGEAIASKSGLITTCAAGK